jgi:hypothetical protein
MMELFEKIIAFFQDKYKKMTGEAKHRFALVCTAVFVVLLTLSVIISISKSAVLSIPPENERPRINLAIPAEEMFLPDEPDFLPGTLLERERRTIWTEQDAVDYWQDPLRSGEEQWREKIEAAVDEFLERIP